jgi:hypothetical protein
MDRSALTRERAYYIWESEGCPEGYAMEHWLRAEQEISANQDKQAAQPRFDTEASDQEGIRAAREYERGVKESEQKGQAEAQAAEAERALEGKEGEALKKAEQIGKSRRKGEDLGGAR